MTSQEGSKVLDLSTLFVLERNIYYYDYFDALIGLQYGDIHDSQLDSYFDSLYSQDLIQAQLFAINYNSNGQLGNNPIEEDDDDNHIIFGGWDDSVLLKDASNCSLIHWVSVLPNQDYWSFSIEKMLFNGHPISLPNIRYFGLTDIGTSLIYLPKMVYDAWYQ